MHGFCDYVSYFTAIDLWIFAYVQVSLNSAECVTN